MGSQKEALRTRMSRTSESLKAHSRPLRPLSVGERVFLQNQTGPSPNKWDRSGLIVEVLNHNQYRVKVNGSGRLTLRNRRFLRAYTPVPTSTPQTIANTPPPPSGLQQPPMLNPPTSLQMTPDAATTGGNRHGTPSVDTLAPASVKTSPLPSGNQLLDPRPPDYPEYQDIPTGPTAPAPEPTSSLPTTDRPQRSRRPPKRYEPETGHWIEH